MTSCIYISPCINYHRNATFPFDLFNISLSIVGQEQLWRCGKCFSGSIFRLFYLFYIHNKFLSTFWAFPAAYKSCNGSLDSAQSVLDTISKNIMDYFHLLSVFALGKLHFLSSFSNYPYTVYFSGLFLNVEATLMKCACDPGAKGNEDLLDPRGHLVLQLA